MDQFTISARLDFNTTVTVEADTAEEALLKFDRGEFVDDGMGGAEMVDWDQNGQPKALLLNASTRKDRMAETSIFEPGSSAASARTDDFASLRSIAISLKRIADAMERVEISGGPREGADLEIWARDFFPDLVRGAAETDAEFRARFRGHLEGLHSG